MTTKEKAKEILQYTFRRPRMYAASKEAMLQRVTVILEMCGIIEHQLYEDYVEKIGNNCNDIFEPFSVEWGESLISEALKLLEESE